MPRPSRIVAPFLAIWLISVCTRPASAAGDYTFHHEDVMGTSLELRVRANSPAAASAAEARTLAEIDRLAAIFSGHDPTSEFRRWQATPIGQPVHVSPELFEVLRACDRWREATGGAFDVRAAALTRLWAVAAKRGSDPSPEERAAALSMMTRPSWRFDPSAGTAVRASDCPVSLDGIAKGYIVGKACAAAVDPARGATGALLNVGGDLRASGEGDWKVAVADPASDSETGEPVARVVVQGRSVSTSGRSQRGFRVGGKWYSHILDPRTGRPAERTTSATVIADDPAAADALATAFNVLTAGESLALAKSVGVECLIVGADGKVSRTDGWPEAGNPVPALALADAPEAPEPAAGAVAPWGDDHELRVDFEINRPEAEKGRYRRPYVAIWVEDRNGFPVRNLTLWVSLGGSGPFQWLPDLKRWYLSDQARKKVDKTDMVITMARPTRPPGKYTVVWDGKDDHGKPLGRGEYTLCIDSAREHGTYQSLREPVEIADVPFTVELKGGVEIKSASVEYRRKAVAK